MFNMIFSKYFLFKSWLLLTIISWHKNVDWNQSKWIFNYNLSEKCNLLNCYSPQHWLFQSCYCNQLVIKDTMRNSTKLSMAIDYDKRNSFSICQILQSPWCCYHECEVRDIFQLDLTGHICLLQNPWTQDWWTSTWPCKSVLNQLKQPKLDPFKLLSSTRTTSLQLTFLQPTEEG